MDREVITFEDVEFDEESFCEHCYDLPPFTPTVEDGARYCLDCALSSATMSEEDHYKVQVRATELQLEYHEEQVESLRKWLLHLKATQKPNT